MYTREARGRDEVGVMGMTGLELVKKICVRQGFIVSCPLGSSMCKWMQ